MTAAYAEAKGPHDLTDHAKTGSDHATTGSPHVVLKHLGTQVANWIADRLDYYDAVAELRALSDRNLDDINIPRPQIREIAWRSVVDRRAGCQG
jgi:uncharacterized protein YjiS (DUF1127 family)